MNREELAYNPSQQTWKKNRNTNNKPSTVNMKVMWERDNENELEQHTHPHNRIGFMSAKYPLSCGAHVQRG